MGFIFGLALAAIAAIFVGMDAEKRDMNGLAWGVGVFLVCLVFLPLYLIMRKPLPTVLAPTPSLCPHCGKYYQGQAQFCPLCGAPQTPRLP